jgi:DHA1 family tetracycline resistance protein-like MFS transporter
VLLISLAGAAVNYLFLAFAPSLWMLLIGRAIAGLTSANISVATAYITDISPEDKRARRFGLFNAMFGIGFIVGPILGGVLGDYWLRLPFVAAAMLNGCNLLLAFFVLPETRTPSREKLDLAALNPLRPLRWVAARASTGPACGSACRSAPSASARRWRRPSSPAQPSNYSANAPPSSPALPAPAQH